MIQSLDVISVNLWDILISLANLTILFLLVKKFLFQPVKNIMAKRQNEIDAQYQSAEEKEQKASAYQNTWEEKIRSAEDEANTILSDAVSLAKSRGEKIISEAETRADSIVRQAEAEAKLEREKVADGIKREIIEVSEVLTEKMLEREINTEDHRELIDSFIEKIGDGDGGNQ